MYRKTVLENGLRVLTSELPHVRSVSVSALIGAGSRYETAEQAGISHFVEHVLFKGTKNRPTSKAIAEAIEGIGGILNGGTDKELTVFWIKAVNDHLGLALDVLADLIRYPKFDPDEVEKERQVIFEEINMSMDSPQQRVNLLIDEVIWPNQPLGRDVAGFRETVSVFTAQMLRDYWISQYGPAKTVISVAGSVEHSQVVEIVRNLFCDWSQGEFAKFLPAEESQSEPRICLEHRDTEQSHLCIGLRGLSSRHPDRFIFDVINVILGEGMSCRFFREIREKKGLAYDIHSYVSHFFDTGSFVVYAGISPNNVEAAVEALLGELAKMKHESVPESELAKAIEQVKGRLILRMEDSRSVSGWIASQELLINEVKTVDEVIQIVESITADDLQRVANDLFRSNALSVAIVGPAPDETNIKALLKL